MKALRLHLTRAQIITAIRAGTERQVIGAAMRAAGLPPEECPGCFERLMAVIERERARIIASRG